MTFPFAIVGFDLDGTFLDTSGDLAAAVNFALGDAGRPALSVEAIKPMIGGGAKHMLEQGMIVSGGCEPDALQRLYKLLLGHYEVNISRYTRPFPGATDALDALDALGVRCAIVTNKFESLAVKLLTELGLFERFGTVIGGDTMGPGKSKPSPAPIHAMIERLGGGRAAFVGDSRFDIEAARNARVPSIAVAFGFLAGPVGDLRADAVIDAYDQLIPTLERLGDATSSTNAAPA